MHIGMNTLLTFKNHYNLCLHKSRVNFFKSTEIISETCVLTLICFLQDLMERENDNQSVIEKQRQNLLKYIEVIEHL